jgi:hypothetical protein
MSLKETAKKAKNANKDGLHEKIMADQKKVHEEQDKLLKKIITYAKKPTSTGSYMMLIGELILRMENAQLSAIASLSDNSSPKTILKTISTFKVEALKKYIEIIKLTP